MCYVYTYRYSDIQFFTRAYSAKRFVKTVTVFWVRTSNLIDCIFSFLQKKKSLKTFLLDLVEKKSKKSIFPYSLIFTDRY